MQVNIGLINASDICNCQVKNTKKSNLKSEAKANIFVNKFS